MPQLNLSAPPIDAQIMALIRMAVAEDLGPGDQTVQLAIPQSAQGSAQIVARKPGTLAGAFLINPILAEYSPDHALTCTLAASDGTRLARNQIIATLTGPVRALLSAERVLLNFLGHVSGIATLTARYADTIAAAIPDPQKRPALCDTRKTTPAFRILDKYAVRCGGGTNHRLGLYDGVMLKDNHLAALRSQHGNNLSLAQLCAKIRAELDPKIPLWLEVDTLAQLEDALPTSPEQPAADIILLDNFDIDQMQQAVQIRNNHRLKLETGNSKLLLEASGGITLDNLPAIAKTGVDRISIGALTHSAPVLDLALDWGTP